MNSNADSMVNLDNHDNIWFKAHRHIPSYFSHMLHIIKWQDKTARASERTMVGISTSLTSTLITNIIHSKGATITIKYSDDVDIDSHLRSKPTSETSVLISHIADIWRARSLFAHHWVHSQCAYIRQRPQRCVHIKRGVKILQDVKMMYTSLWSSVQLHQVNLPDISTSGLENKRERTTSHISEARLVQRHNDNRDYIRVGWQWGQCTSQNKKHQWNFCVISSLTSGLICCTSSLQERVFTKHCDAKWGGYHKTFRNHRSQVWLSWVTSVNSLMTRLS